MVYVLANEGVGTVCVTVTQYQCYLEKSGFEDVECIWRDYWLAIFVARKRDDVTYPNDILLNLLAHQVQTVYTHLN